MCADCKNQDPNQETEKSVSFKEGAEALNNGAKTAFGFLGKSVILIGRGVANGTAAVGKGIASEWKRQQEEGF